MSRSQPKPKIIFKTLEDLIKSSSISKKKTENVDEEIRCHTLPLRSVTQTSTSNMPRSNSKHSIKSKEKPPHNDRRQTSLMKQCREVQSINMEFVDSQIGKIYDQMETYLHQSKTKVIDEIKTESNPRKIQAKVKELEKMSDYLKHIIDVFTNDNSQILLNQRKILKESTKQNEDIDTLSRNHKKKVTSRFAYNDPRKKPSVYESILNRMG